MVKSKTSNQHTALCVRSRDDEDRAVTAIATATAFSRTTRRRAEHAMEHVRRVRPRMWGRSPIRAPP